MSAKLMHSRLVLGLTNIGGIRVAHVIFISSAPASQGSQMIRPYQGIAPQVHPSCYVDESAQLIGDVTLAENSRVWMHAVLRGDVHLLPVEDNANLHGVS